MDGRWQMAATLEDFFPVASPSSPSSPFLPITNTLQYHSLLPIINFYIHALRVEFRYRYTLTTPLEIRFYSAHNSSAQFERLKTMIYNPNSIGQPASYYGGMASSSSPAARSTPTAAPGGYLNHGAQYNMGGGDVAYRGHVPQSKNHISL